MGDSLIKCELEIGTSGSSLNAELAEGSLDSACNSFSVQVAGFSLLVLLVQVLEIGWESGKVGIGNSVLAADSSFLLCKFEFFFLTFEIKLKELSLFLGMSFKVLSGKLECLLLDVLDSC